MSDSTSSSPLKTALLLPILPSILLFLLVWSKLHTIDQKSPFILINGEVARIECENKGKYQVKYTVSNRELVEVAGNNYLRDSCEKRFIGEKVHVWYSESDPHFAAFIHPKYAREIIKKELIMFAIFPYLTWAVFVYMCERFRFLSRRA